MASDILKQLEELKQNDSRLTEAVDLYSDLIRARDALDVRPVVAPVLDGSSVMQERFSKGIPLVRAEEMALEWGSFADLFQTVCEIAAHHRPDLSIAFEGLLKQIQDDPDEIRGLTAAFLDNGSVWRSHSTDASGKDDNAEQLELLDFVLTHALHPFLQPLAEALIPSLEEQLGSDWDQYWQRGRCPICGGEPDFAYLDQDAGNRHLVCSRCDSSWQFPRIRCAFCDTTEPSDLSYYPSTDDVHRVYACRQCKRYLKAVDQRRSQASVCIPVERVSTMDLDLEAREQGYR